jgi:cell division protein FtsW (lipid II flippase)
MRLASPSNFSSLALSVYFASYFQKSQEGLFEQKRAEGAPKASLLGPAVLLAAAMLMLLIGIAILSR